MITRGLPIEDADGFAVIATMQTAIRTRHILEHPESKNVSFHGMTVKTLSLFYFMEMGKFGLDHENGLLRMRTLFS